MNQLELAEACGWDSQGRISNYENDRREPSLSELKRLANELKVSYSWLATGAGDPDSDQDGDVKSGENLPLVSQPAIGVLSWDDDQPLPEDQFVLIPRLDVKLSAGHGTVVFEVDEKQPLAFRREWLVSLGANPKDIAIFKATGDSMEPKISDGNTLFVNLAQTNIIDNKIYAIRYGDELRVKRVFKHFTGGLRIVSDNPAYPEEIIRPEDLHYVQIIGRVIWAAGTL